MCVQDLIDRLEELSEHERMMPVCCEDGMDPSDPDVIISTTIQEASPAMGFRGQYVYLST